MSMSNGVTGGVFATLSGLQASKPRINTQLSLNGTLYTVNATNYGSAIPVNGFFANPVTKQVIDISNIQSSIDTAGSNSVHYLPYGVFELTEAIKIDGTNRDLVNVTIEGVGTLKLADSVQRQNIIESISGSDFTVKDITVQHNADRGGFFSRHAPKPGITANSGALVNGTKPIGSSSIDVDAATLAGSVGGGNTFTVDGDSTIYTITNFVTAAGNAMAGITFTPTLVAEATDNSIVNIGQASFYKTKTTASTGDSLLNFDALNVQANSGVFPLTQMYIGEQFQFMRRVTGSFNGYEVDPTHNTVYTITSNVPMAAGGIGEEFLNVGISPALTQGVDQNIFITSIQDANNRYSNGVYLAGCENPRIENVKVNQTVWHGILVGTGPRTATGTSVGGDKGIVTDCIIDSYGGNGIAMADQTNTKINKNYVSNNFSGVGAGIFPDSECDGCSIVDNTVEGAVWGIFCLSSTGYKIALNTLYNNDIGIVVDANGDNNVIKGNIITGNATSSAGIFLRKGDLKESYPYTATDVEGNIISNITSGAGIVVPPFAGAVSSTIFDDVAFVNIRGNIITDVGSYGISLTSIVNSKIDSNIIVRSGNDGINGTDMESVRFSNNDIYNAGVTTNASGIYIEESTDITIKQNTAVTIPFTTSSTDYGLEFGPNVVSYIISDNAFKGDVSQTLNVDVKTQGSVLTVDATLDFPSVPAGTHADLTITLTGVKSLDAVIVVPPSAGIGSMMFTGFVSAANTVTVRAFNPTGVAIDLASLTFRVKVDTYI